MATITCFNDLDTTLTLFGVPVRPGELNGTSAPLLIASSVIRLAVFYGFRIEDNDGTATTCFSLLDEQTKSEFAFLGVH
ncbi:hypothetical protein OUZ56_020399 [Daphnia magna]|uniref:Uncharacterized protein n=1 Tax=Daphnia magna TaxID=35525 RepID=A0ABQ9ZED9_9CRUS|nr:hypothetical protein OUZ56_020399 [Daphnia magna]